MKNFLFSLFLLLPCLCQAQLNGVDLSAVEATTPLTADQMPLSGTFYSAAHPQMPPLPGNLFGLSGWDLGNGYYLLDDLDGSFSGGFHAMGDFRMSSSDSDGSSDYEFTNSVTPYVYPTNGLWLWITNVSDGTVYANLNGATDFVYEIFSTTNLMAVPTVTNWNIETEVFPGINTNTMPFTVPMAGRNPLFLWARDWTGITSNGNTTPDWWFWLYFGTTDLSDNSMDSQGNAMLSDYQEGLDPNIISFSLQFTNVYWSSNTSGSFSIQEGNPFYEAFVVDDTNYTADAVWQTYAGTNFTLNLGSRQGWHSVWIGLRGKATNEIQTWQWAHLDLNSSPWLVITNPTTSVVDEPIIQIHGYCQESLASISYDISNSSGLFTNQLSEISDQYIDTNAWGITTNYFECLDVPLTNGLNTITMHATDLAGDTTATNFYFTLDYSSKTNPPQIQIVWPLNGTQISGTNFTCVGWISDPTATITTQVTFTNGDTTFYTNGLYTNVYTAVVDRTGNFWIENLPVNFGTNIYPITISDVVGNTNFTNITIIQTNFVLTINPVSNSDPSTLWQATVNLTGTISDPNYAVWVNGVKGTNNGNGTWSASNVPINDGGTANFMATAYAPNEQQPDGSYGN